MKLKIHPYSGIIAMLDIGRFSITLFSSWLGFGHRKFDLSERQDFGFIKFWVWKCPYEED